MSEASLKAKWDTQNAIDSVRREVSERFVKNVLLNTDFSVENVASLTDVSVDFVLKVKANLNSNSMLSVQEVKWDTQNAFDSVRREAIEETGYQFVKNLIVKLGLTNEQAAEVAEVSIDFVEKVRADLQKKDK